MSESDARYLAELRAEQEAVRQMAEQMNSVRITVPVDVTDKLTAAVQRVMADLNAAGLSIKIPVVVDWIGEFLERAWGRI